MRPPQLNPTEYCAAASPSELNALLKPAKPLAAGADFSGYFLCLWAPRGDNRAVTLSVQEARPPAGQSAREVFAQGRAEAIQKAGIAQPTGVMKQLASEVQTRDEDHIGESAYSTSMRSGVGPSLTRFSVLVHGSVLVFQMTNSTDVDGLRPIVAKLSAAYPQLSESGKNPERICSAVQPGELTTLLKVTAPPRGGAGIKGVGALCAWQSPPGRSFGMLQVMLGGPDNGLTAEQSFARDRENFMKDAGLHARDETAIGDRAFSLSTPVSATFIVLANGAILRFTASIVTGGVDPDALRPIVKKLVAAYSG